VLHADDFGTPQQVFKVLEPKPAVVSYTITQVAPHLGKEYPPDPKAA
jgi:hypothetical protein